MRRWGNAQAGEGPPANACFPTNRLLVFVEFVFKATSFGVPQWLSHRLCCRDFSSRQLTGVYRDKEDAEKRPGHLVTSWKCPKWLRKHVAGTVASPLFYSWEFISSWKVHLLFLVNKCLVPTLVKDLCQAWDFFSHWLPQWSLMYRAICPIKQRIIGNFMPSLCFYYSCSL